MTLPRASRSGRAHEHASLVAILLLVVAVVAALAGCRPPAPVQVGRGVLGTAVNATAYGDAKRVRDALDEAFAEMTAVESQLDPYDATSAIAAINASPYEWHTLPPDAVEVYEAVERLEVEQEFSPALWALTRLYDFGGDGSVPTTAQLASAVAAARSLERDGARVRFRRIAGDPSSPGRPDSPGFDFGGAAKGLALDRAAERLKPTGDPVNGFLLSAVSSTLASGDKDDSEPWRVGIEDPRRPGRIIAVVSHEGTGSLSVSTSGDYQTYFERAGIRYHHLLDPATGRPVTGMRSLTVFGSMSALDADILSTALFVMGPGRALAYAREKGIGVYFVDAEGAPRFHDPESPGLRIVPQESPLP